VGVRETLREDYALRFLGLCEESLGSSAATSLGVGLGNGRDDPRSSKRVMESGWRVRSDENDAAIMEMMVEEDYWERWSLSDPVREGKREVGGR
jgi:hypothetical protein